MQQNSEKEICKNCEKAHKRSEFDFKKYGNYQCPYECLAVTDRTEYKKTDDSCPLFYPKQAFK